MKLIQILEADNQEVISRIAKIIKRDCQPFLEKIDYKVAEYPMFRGIRTLPKRVITLHRARLADRQPSDMRPDLHDGLNNYFTKRFGHPYRNGVFVTGNIDTAFTYANPIVVFPIGEFKTVWSHRVDDLFQALVDDPPDLLYNEFESDGGEEENESFVAWVMDDVPGTMDMLEFEEGNLKEAIKSGHEISMWCERYYGVRHPMKLETDFLGIRSPKQPDHSTMEFTLKDLEAAIRG